MSINGYDHLGILHRLYPVKLAAKYFPAGGCLGVLTDTTFGTDLRRINRFNYGFVRAHLLNSTCVRNNKLYPTELLRGYNLITLNRAAETKERKLFNLIDSQLKRLDFINKDKLYVSGLLEHDLSRLGAYNVAEHIKSAGYNTVDSPMQGTYPRLVGIEYERHGHNHKGLDIISQDGLSMSDTQFYGDKPYQKAADLFTLYWDDLMNGRYSGLKEFIPPRERTEFPNDYDFRYYTQLTKDAPPIPKVSGYSELTNKQIWKPRAEDYRKPNDARQGLPCFITKEKVRQFKVLSLKGKQISQMNYYGTIDSRHRYYLGDSSKDNHFTLLAKNDNKEWVLLESGKYKYIINCVRRTGLQR